MGKIRDFIKGVALPEQKTRQALALDAEFEKALADEKQSKARILHLEAEVNPLRRAVEKLEKKIAQLESSTKSALAFNANTGTYFDPSKSIHFCAKCFAGGKRSPLKSEKHGWSCPVCGEHFDDPARPRPKAMRKPTNWRTV